VLQEVSRVPLQDQYGQITSCGGHGSRFWQAWQGG
jgi:hypothetical protein